MSSWFRHRPSYVDRAWAKSKVQHDRIPVLRELPLPAIAIIALLIVVNLAVWTACGIVLSYHTSLVASAVLSWTLGLRHALDADHISAIDLMTRRLVASGQQPVTVGTFFSLGHSTIVVITCIVVASTAEAVSNHFGSFSYIGGIIGSSVSACFLIILGMVNVYIMYKLLQQLKKLTNSPMPAADADPAQDFKIEGGGCLFHVLKKMFKLVDRPWKMYPIGVLFGLGFDTSSEIALLGISAVSASSGTSIWLILLFPILFTAGMCLLDTCDGALMMSLYTSARLGRDAIAVLYYQSVLTGVTVIVAIVIGVIQMLSMVLSVGNFGGTFWDGVAVAGDNYDIIGGAICGSFVFFGVLSFVLYKPWRRRVDAKRDRLRRAADIDGLEQQTLDDGVETGGFERNVDLEDGRGDCRHGVPETIGSIEESNAGPAGAEKATATTTTTMQ